MLEGVPIQGTNVVTATTGLVVVLAAPTNGKYWIKSLLISIEAFAATGTLMIGDGTLVLLSMLLKDGNGSLFSVVFPDEGFELTAGAALNMTIGTASATVRVTATGMKRTTV
jgi:hypothetical protein